MLELFDPAFNERQTYKVPDDPRSFIAHTQDSSILSYLMLFFFFFCISMRNFTTVGDPWTKQADATKCHPLLNDKKFQVKHSLLTDLILDLRVLSMESSMNPSSCAATEMGKKDRDQ